MRKILLISVLILCGFIVNAQSGRVQTYTADTVKGNENITLVIPDWTATYTTITHEAVFSKISAAAGGTAYFQASVAGGTYQTLTSADNLFIFYPNDTVTVTDGGSMMVIVQNNPVNKYRWLIDGDANDTVRIAPYALPKK